MLLALLGLAFGRVFVRPAAPGIACHRSVFENDAYTGPMSAIAGHSDSTSATRCLLRERALLPGALHRDEDASVINDALGQAPMVLMVPERVSICCPGPNDTGLVFPEDIPVCTFPRTVTMVVDADLDSRNLTPTAFSNSRIFPD